MALTKTLGHSLNKKDFYPDDPIASQGRPSRRSLRFWRRDKGIGFYFDFIIPLLVSAISLFIIWPLFKGGFRIFSPELESVSTIVAKYLSENWPGLDWSFLWYGGSPFHIFYTPVFPLLQLALKKYFDLSYLYGYRVLSGLSYILIPVGFYFFAKYLSRRTLTAIIASLIFLFSPSLSYLIPSLKTLAAEYHYAPWNFVSVILGQGNHNLAFFFMMMAGLFLVLRLRRKTLVNLLGLGFFTSLVALTSPVAFFSLLLLFLVISFSEIALIDDVAQNRMSIFLGGLIFCLGLIAFWYNWDFLKALFNFSQGEEISNAYLKAIPYLTLAFPWIIIVFFWIFGSRGKLQGLSVGVAWFTLIGLITGTYYFFGRSLAPEAGSYILELDLALALILGSFLTLIFDWIYLQSHGLAKFFGLWFFAAVVFVTLYYSWPFIDQARSQAAGQSEDPATTPISKVGAWFNENLDLNNAMVFVPAPFQKWLNYFSSVHQLTGPFNRSLANPWIEAVSEEIQEGTKVEEAITLAKAMNVGYLVVNQDYLDPAKFNKKLKKVFEADGQAIFKVDLTNEKLVQTVDLSALAGIQAPQTITQTDQFKKYVAWKEKGGTELATEFKSNEKIVIAGNLGKDEGILIKNNYHLGWQAVVNGKKVKVFKDPLGFMLLKPDQTGQVKIELSFHKTWPVWLGYGITIYTLAWLIVYILRYFKKPRSLADEG